jgi:signal transduction histidine kinase
MTAGGDLAFLAEEIPAALERAQDGLARVAAIVKSMKQVAYPERRDMTPVDLNAALRSTLTIARSEYRYVADLDLALGELPPVRCHIGDINQAVLNLVVNAAHAIGDVVGDSGAKGVITVRTFRDGDDAVIAVTDTGGGIPDRVRDRMFEPFFTTKDVGKGTGQGLAITRAVVVDTHGGTLGCDSVLGTGTTFTLRLPIDGRARTNQPLEIAA